MADSIAQFEGEPFQAYSTRTVELECTPSGVILIAVTTKWGTNSDRSCIAVTTDELARINGIVNDDDYREPSEPETNIHEEALLESIKEAQLLLGGQ